MNVCCGFSKALGSERRNVNGAIAIARWIGGGSRIRSLGVGIEKRLKRVILSANGLTLFDGPSYKRDPCLYRLYLGTLPDLVWVWIQV